MRGKIILVAGMAIGYVLGARAGRERYEDIKRAAGKLWNDPKVQHQVHNAEDFAKDKTPEVVGFLAEGAKKVATQVSGKSRKTSTKKASSKTKKAPASTSTDSTTNSTNSK